MAEDGRDLTLSPPLTTDHLIRTRILPAWVDAPRWDDPDTLAEQIDAALQQYADEYRQYLDRHTGRMPDGVHAFPPTPAVVLLPGLGALCAGEDAKAAVIARDITEQTLAAKCRIAEMGGTYEMVTEDHLFDMEYRPLQHAKLATRAVPALFG